MDDPITTLDDTMRLALRDPTYTAHLTDCAKLIRHAPVRRYETGFIAHVLPNTVKTGNPHSIFFKHRAQERDDQPISKHHDVPLSEAFFYWTEIGELAYIDYLKQYPHETPPEDDHTGTFLHTIVRATQLPHAINNQRPSSTQLYHGSCHRLTLCDYAMLNMGKSILPTAALAVIHVGTDELANIAVIRQNAQSTPLLIAHAESIINHWMPNNNINKNGKEHDSHYTLTRGTLNTRTHALTLDKDLEYMYNRA